MKHDTFEKYPPKCLDLIQRALLTTWDCLAAYRDDLVLVGGLAVRHLTRRAPEGLPDAVTIDVDFGINIAASGGMYGTIKDTLSAHGFQWVNKRFERKFSEMTLIVDLLTDNDGKANVHSVIVDDSLAVGVVPGISRALICYRTMEILGETLVGVEQKERIRIAEVGPMLVMKLNAFAGRKAPKDAHDVEYLAINYLDGFKQAVAGFHHEKEAGNRGMPQALQALQNYFSGVDDPGPMACAAFRLNNAHLHPDNEEESLRIRQRCVTLAHELLG